MSAEFPYRQSSIKAYLECPRRARLAYVERRQSRTFAAMGIGTASHRGAEAVLLAKRDGREWSPDVAAVEAVRAAHDVVATVDFAGAEDERGPFVDRAAAYARAYAEAVAPSVDVVDVERYVRAEIAGVEVHGTIDVVEPTRIRDTKTTRKAPPVWGEPGYRFQLGLYAALAAEACFDVVPREAVIDVLVLSERSPRATKANPFPVAERTIRYLPIVLDEAALAEERESAIETVAAVRARVERDEWDRNPAACQAYGRPCDFIGECYPSRARALAAAKRDDSESEAA